MRDERTGQEFLALDFLAASALWRHRAANGYFDDDRGEPDPGRRPPSLLLVDPRRPDAGLVLPAVMDEAQAEAWQRWRSDLGTGRSSPLTAAGERFLASGV